MAHEIGAELMLVVDGVAGRPTLTSCLSLIEANKAPRHARHLNFENESFLW